MRSTRICMFLVCAALTGFLGLPLTGSVSASTVTPPAPSPLFESIISSWTSANVGTSAPGATNVNPSSTWVKGSGADIWGTSDGFRYAYNWTSGDFEFWVKMTQWNGSTNPWSKAGLMVRNSANANAANAAVLLTGSNGIQFQYRPSDGASTSNAAGPASFSLPIWIKLRKVGTSVTAHYATNGSNWIQFAGAVVNLNSSFTNGLAVSSHLDGYFADATFDSPATGPVAGSGSGSNGATYYVDCWNGNDGNSGRGTSQAWKSIAKANGAALAPGDQLLFLRGCAWNGTLKANWKGTTSSPILIGAYGSGALPKIQNGAVDMITIGGQYQILDSLQVRSDPPWKDPNCQNQPVGWRAGFTFQGTAAYNTVRNSYAGELTAGAILTNNSNHNKILNSTFVNNNYMSVDTNNGGSDDSGAWGIVVNGNDNEIAFNYFENNNAWCSYDFGVEGASIEVYEGQRNNIHHNQSRNDTTFSELGGSAALKANYNNYAYNIYASTKPNSMFLILRGGLEPLGPTLDTHVYNNTVYLPSSGSQGVVCSSGCNYSILTLRNNILWADTKAIFVDGAFYENNNIYWSSNGNPLVQFMGFGMSASSKKANPSFVNAGAFNFSLNSNSPAINAGTSASISAGYTFDFNQTPVPQGSAVDIGAVEYK